MASCYKSFTTENCGMNNTYIYEQFKRPKLIETKYFLGHTKINVG